MSPIVLKYFATSGPNSSVLRFAEFVPRVPKLPYCKWVHYDNGPTFVGVFDNCDFSIKHVFNWIPFLMRNV